MLVNETCSDESKLQYWPIALPFQLLTALPANQSNIKLFKLSLPRRI